MCKGKVIAQPVSALSVSGENENLIRANVGGEPRKKRLGCHGFTSAGCAKDNRERTRLEAGDLGLAWRQRNRGGNPRPHKFLLCHAVKTTLWHRH
jgi:hypothetical protein